jgi:hypothetical protein
MIVSAVNFSPFSAMLSYAAGGDSDFSGTFESGGVEFAYDASERHLTLTGTISEAYIPDFTEEDSPLYGCQAQTVDINYVSSVGSYVFSHCTALQNVTVPSELTSIGNYAFNECTALESVTMHEYIETIGEGAFYGCSSLLEFSIPDSAPLTEINAFTFSGCTSLASVTLSDGILGVGESAFSGCTLLADISLGSSLQVIRSGAFENSGLTSISLPEPLVDIEASAFSGCTSLSGFEASYNLSTIGANVFEGCTALETAWLDGVMTLGSEAFLGCTSLASVSLSNGITIGSGAFSGCSSLEKLILPKSCMLETGALSDFDNDVYYRGNIDEWLCCIGDGGEPEDDRDIGIEYPRSNPRIHLNYLDQSGIYNMEETVIYEFDESTGTLTLTGTGEARSPKEEYLFRGNADIRAVVFGSGITGCEEEMFSDCSSLESVTLPETFEWISSYCFNGCTSLTELDIPSSVLEIGDGAFSNCSFSSFDIPETVTSLGEGVFWGCSDLTEVTIPSNITRIPDNTFAGTGFTSIVIPDTVTEIGASAFHDCYDLAEVDLGTGVTSIENSAFYDCVSLRGIYIPPSVSEIGDTAFGYAENITINEKFPELMDEFDEVYWIYRIKNFRFSAKCTDTTAAENYIEDSDEYESKTMGWVPNPETFFTLEAVHDWELPTCIADGVCKNCSATIPCKGHQPETDPAREPTYTEEGLTEGSHCSVCGEIIVAQNTIPKLVFVSDDDSVDASYNDVSGTLVISGQGEMPNSGEGAVFEGNADIKKVVIEEGITSVGENTFRNCSNLESVVLPDSLTAIDSGAFDGCSSLKSIDIPDNLVTINDNAFSNTGLGSVTVPGSVDTIGDSAFEGCTNLKNVTLVDGVDMIDDCVFINCPQLTSVYIPSSVDSIGALSFGYVSTDYLTAEQLKAVQDLGYDMNDGTMAKLKNFIFYTDCSQDITAVESYIINSKFLEEEIGIEGSPDISILLLHNNLTEKSRVAATCGKDGKITYTCGCGKKIKETVIAATGKHSYDAGTVTKAATCTAPGIKTLKCTTCGATKTQAIAALGHSYKATVKAPTCTQKGCTVHTCTRCQSSYNDTYKNAKGHSWNAGEITKAPTYTAKGEKTFTCKTCGALKTAAVPVLEKLNNTLTVKLKKKVLKNSSLKASKLKNKNYTIAFSKIATVKDAEGTLDYRISNVRGGNTKKKIKIDRKTGKITFGQGLKKGAYTVTVDVRAGGNVEFKAASRQITFKVTVVD